MLGSWLARCQRGSCCEPSGGSVSVCTASDPKDTHIGKQPAMSSPSATSCSLPHNQAAYLRKEDTTMSQPTDEQVQPYSADELERVRAVMSKYDPRSIIRRLMATVDELLADRVTTPDEAPRV